jgi:hypothetical protein
MMRLGGSAMRLGIKAVADGSLEDCAGLVSGQYLLTEVHHRVKQDGERYLRLVLDHAGGTVMGLLWSERVHLAVGLTLMLPVQVSGRVFTSGSDRALSVETLSAASVSGVDSGVALLPRRFCPELALGAFEELQSWAGALPYALKWFVGQVLLDPKVGIAFLRCKAAASYHHAYRGGLLVHSTELMDLAGVMAQRLMPDEPLAVPLTQIAVLFHDLGKVVTVGEGSGGRPIREPAFVDQSHEQITWQLLAPHLDELEPLMPEAAAVLRSAFRHMAERRPRVFAQTLLADIARMVDQLSTAMDRGVGLGSGTEASDGTK